MSKSDIKINHKELVYTRNDYRIEFQINNKIAIVEIHTTDGPYDKFKFDYEFLNEVELTDEDTDALDDFINTIKF